MYLCFVKFIIFLKKVVILSHEEISFSLNVCLDDMGAH